MTDETSAPEAGEDNTSPLAGMFGHILNVGVGGSTRAPYRGSFDRDAIDALAKLGADSTKPEVVMIPTEGLEPGLPARVPVLWDRDTQMPISVIDLVEEARPKLVRKGTARATTLDSFVDLVNRHKDEDSAIFASTSWPAPKLSAVIDYHTAAHEARRGNHKVEYGFPLTDEFKTWVSGNGKSMEQPDFAAFLEEHAAELAAPMDGEKLEFEALFKARFATPAELIDLSRSLEIFVGGTVKNAARPSSGERQLVFTTEHTGANGEKLDIPGLFMVSVAPFVAGDGEAEVVRIVARICYRVKGGDISWFYQLYRWESVLRDRIQQDLAAAASATGLPAYEGTPEMAG